MLHIDVETRSVCDLKKSGAYRYSEDPSTEVLCMALLDGDTLQRSTWVPGQPIPQGFLDSFPDVAAWNASFERLMYSNILVPQHGFPPLSIDNFYDPSALARQYGLPSGLGTCALALGLSKDQQKDKEGRAIMLKMSKPRRIESGQPVWWDTPELRQQLLDYCIQDVEVEYAIHCKLTNKDSNVRVNHTESSPQESSRQGASDQRKRNASTDAHPEFDFADSASQ